MAFYIFGSSWYFCQLFLSPSSEKHDFFLKRLMMFGCFRGPLKMYAFPVHFS